MADESKSSSQQIVWGRHCKVAPWIKYISSNDVRKLALFVLILFRHTEWKIKEQYKIFGKYNLANFRKQSIWKWISVNLLGLFLETMHAHLYTIWWFIYEKVGFMRMEFAKNRSVDRLLICCIKEYEYNLLMNVFPGNTCFICTYGCYSLLELNVPLIHGINLIKK